MAGAFSDDALAAIEFPAVLDVIAAHAAGPLGAEVVRRLAPGREVAWVREELDRVGEVLALLRRGDDIAVEAVPELGAALARLATPGSVLGTDELAAILTTLHAAVTILGELNRVGGAAPRLSLLRAPAPDRDVTRRLEHAIGDDGVLDRASAGLAAARREVHTARERLIRRLERILRDADPATVVSGAGVTLRNGRYVIPLRRDARHRPDGIVHDESASTGTLFVEPTATVSLGNDLRAAIASVEYETLLVLRQLTEELRPHVEAIRALHAMAVDIDGVAARARWAYRADGEVPRIADEEGALELRRARHPLLLARGLAVTPFDLVLTPHQRTLLISGPNAGGKSVLLKTVGLVVALALAGVVPAVGAESVVPAFTQLFVDIGDHQSVAADLSTFSAHISVLRHILDRADAATLVLLDEIGSGTDPAEGGALAAATLESLTTRRTVTIATTHLGALKTLASDHAGIVNGSLQFDAATLSPTYQFTKGIPGRSYGLAIARRLGVAPEVVARADALVPGGERALDQLLASVETRREALDRAEATLGEELRALEDARTRMAADAAALAARETAFRAEENEAQRGRVRATRAYLLEARKQIDDALAQARQADDPEQARAARRTIETMLRDQTKRVDAPDAEAESSADGVTVGRRVRLGTGTIGTVLAIRDGKATVQTGALRVVVATNTLAVLADAAVSRPAPPPVVDAPSSGAVEPLDLRGMRVHEAEAAVIAAVDRAVLADQPWLAIIHGMGTGALRDVVRTILAADRRVVSFDFAPRPQGGLGVTVATLR